MLAAVGFNDEAAFGASEIRDAPPNRFLPAELVPPNLPVAEMMPETPLGIGSLTPKRSRMRINPSDCGHWRS